MVEDDKKVVKGAVKQRQKLIGVAVIPSDILQTNQKGLVENYLLNWIMVVLKTLIWKYFYFVVLFSSLISCTTKLSIADTILSILMYSDKINSI